MSAASVLFIAILAQSPPQRVEVHGGGSTFWYAGASTRWEQVRGDVLLQAQRSGDGAARGQLMVTVVRADELWTVELSQPRLDEALVDSDVDGPGGSVHAALAFRGRARVTRRGQVLTETARMQAFALTTGFHSDDGTFRMLPQPRSNDLELLVHLDDVPGEGPVDLGFDWPEIWLNGAPVLAHRAAIATAPDRSGAPPGGSGGPNGAAEYFPAPRTVSSDPHVGGIALTGAAGGEPILASPWTGGAQSVAKAVSPANAAGSASYASAPWSDGAQALSKTVVPVNSVAPSSAVGSWNGGEHAGAASCACGAQAVPEPPPPAMALPGGASPLTTATPDPGVEPVPLVVASPRNGVATLVVPVTAGPANPAGGPTPLVVASPWNGGARREDAAEGGVRSRSLEAGGAPTSSLSRIRDVPLADRVGGSAQ